MSTDEKEKLHKQFQRKVKQVSAIFQNKPDNVREEMEKIGYEWVDDGTDEIERQEEASATPRNERERFLVDYFEGKIELSADVLKLFLSEKNSDDTNYPLFRRYFKRGNAHLKNLLLFGLRQNPTSHSLLMDLVYFNEFHPNIVELKNAFLVACRGESDLDAFEGLARDFWICTESCGYEVLSELLKILENDTAKIKIVEMLVDEFREPAGIRHHILLG